MLISCEHTYCKLLLVTCTSLKCDIYFKAVWYTPKNESIDVSWWDYHDPESGIDGYTLWLYEGLSCVTSEEDFHLKEKVDFAGNVTNHQFFNLELKVIINT